MHTIQGFSENPRPKWNAHAEHAAEADRMRSRHDDLMAAQSPKITSPKKKPQNLAMGTVSKADLGGKKLNPYTKPQPPQKPSQIVDRM